MQPVSQRRVLREGSQAHPPTTRRTQVRACLVNSSFAMVGALRRTRPTTGERAGRVPIGALQAAAQGSRARQSTVRELSIPMVRDRMATKTLRGARHGTSFKPDTLRGTAVLLRLLRRGRACLRAPRRGFARGRRARSVGGGLDRRRRRRRRLGLGCGRSFGAYGLDWWARGPWCRLVLRAAWSEGWALRKRPEEVAQRAEHAGLARRPPTRRPARPPRGVRRRDRVGLEVQVAEEEHDGGDGRLRPCVASCSVVHVVYGCRVPEGRRASGCSLDA